MTPRIEACILAGGLSSRMGRDKSQLRLSGRTLAGWIRRAAQAAGLPVRILRKDRVPRCGPLGGVFTALQTSRHDGVLFLSCDMPLVSPQFLRRLCRSFASDQGDVFTKSGGYFGFPFLLRRMALPVVWQAIQAKQYSLQTLANSLHPRCVRPPPSRTFELLNANTPEDWRQIQSLARIRMKPPSRSQQHVSSGNLPSRGRRQTAREAILEVDDLSIRRGSTTILDCVDWRILPGQHWVMIGANGSGKTSLLSALTGYLTPTDGQIAVLGQVHGQTDLRELRKKIGLVSSSIRQMMAPDEPALETVLSGKDAMIDFWGKASPAEWARARRILRQIECGRLEKRPWIFLSQGERQRILIGRALMAKPKLLVLDEPCAGLDPAAREHFLQFLEHLARLDEAPTLVLVTHHVEEILPAFSHALILKSGRVLAAGPKGDCLTAATLADAFGASCRLRLRRGRYSLEVAPKRGSII